MKPEEHFARMLADYSLVLEELEYTLSQKFLTWLKKRRALVKDIQEEEKEISNFVKKEVVPFLGQQKKDISKLLEEVNKK